MSTTTHLSPIFTPSKRDVQVFKIGLTLVLRWIGYGNTPSVYPERKRYWTDTATAVGDTLSLVSRYADAKSEAIIPHATPHSLTPFSLLFEVHTRLIVNHYIRQILLSFLWNLWPKVVFFFFLPWLPARGACSYRRSDIGGRCVPKSGDGIRHQRGVQTLQTWWKDCIMAMSQRFAHNGRCVTSQILGFNYSSGSPNHHSTPLSCCVSLENTSSLRLYLNLLQ